MVLYKYDSNAILFQALRNITKEAMLDSQKELHTLLVHQGLCLKLQHLDKEMRDTLIELMKKEEFQLSTCPRPQSLVEHGGVGYQNVEKYVLAGIISAELSPPMHLWDRLLDQTYWTFIVE